MTCKIYNFGIILSLVCLGNTLCAGDSSWSSSVANLKQQKENRAKNNLTFSDWRVSKYFDSKKFQDKFSPELKLAMLKENIRENKNKLWAMQPKNWKNNTANNLGKQSNSTRYIYRDVVAINSESKIFYFGSDDGLEIWLNGKKIFSKEYYGPLKLKMFKVPLNFKKGNNELLLKVYNKGAGSSFSMSSKKTKVFFEQKLADMWAKYPIQMDWLLQDSKSDMTKWRTPSYDGDNFIKELLSDTKPNKVKFLINNAISELPLEKQSKFTKIMTDLIAKKYSLTEWLKLYKQVCLERRVQRLQPLLKKSKEVIFTKHQSFGNISGIYCVTETEFGGSKSGLFSLDLTPEMTADGKFATEKLLFDNKGGLIRDPNIHWDADKLLFSWWKKPLKKYATRSRHAPKDNYQVYEMNLKNRNIRQLTYNNDSYGANFEATYLPNDDIVFSSARIIQHITCGWGDCSNLFLMNKDGKYQRRIGFDQTNTTFPNVLNDGTIIYTRRDYNDRGQVYAHALFQMNIDGSKQLEYYGNNTIEPTNFQHAAPIPNRDKILAIIGGYHTSQGGKLVTLNIKKGRQGYSGLTAIPSGKKPIITKTSHDSFGKEGDQYSNPFAIDENSFLVSYMPIGINLTKNGGLKRFEHYDGTKIRYKLYFMTMDGKRELLIADKDTSCLQSVVVMKRKNPPVFGSQLDYTKDYGTFMIQDVYIGHGMDKVKRGDVKSIRVVELEYKPATISGSTWNPKNWAIKFGGYGHTVLSIGTGSASYDIKRILGSATVYTDGSAYFKVPSKKPVYFQLLDKKNKVIHTMRSWTVLMPGENFACIGCHEDKLQTPVVNRRQLALALRSGVEELKPFYSKARGFSFVKEIQPILDKNCISCHAPGKKAASYDLTSRRYADKFNSNGWKGSGRNFTISYLTLLDVKNDGKTKLDHEKLLAFNALGHPNNFVSYWTRLGRTTLINPYTAGSIKSGLMKKLESKHGKTNLTREELDKIAAWIDLNVPYAGDYYEENNWNKTQRNFYNERIQLRKESELLQEKQIKNMLNDR